MELVKKAFSETGLRVFAWASLISEILIVVTGGAVRLTASGLGCPTWPKCTPENLVTTPEMGIHGVIEFTNRLLTFVLLLVAVLFLAIAIRTRKQRRILVTAFALIFGIVLQAVVGGISVLTKLNPWVVGLHFVISGLMIAISAVQMWRVYEPKVTRSSSLERILSLFLVLFTSIAILVGIVVTGSGPHAGDAEAPRNGLDSELWQHFHSYPAYAALSIGIALLLSVRSRDVDGYASRLVFWTVFGLLAQAVVGIAQARSGLPVWMVLIHMFLASCLCSLITFQWLAIKKS
jgi:cytochrome c oxidase assembly protein subunit 15